MNQQGSNTNSHALCQQCGQYYALSGGAHYCQLQTYPSQGISESTALSIHLTRIEAKLDTLIALLSKEAK